MKIAILANNYGEPWAEGGKNNVRQVEQSTDLKEGAEALADRAIEMAAELLKVPFTHDHVARGGRKAQLRQPTAPRPAGIGVP